MAISIATDIIEGSSCRKNVLGYESITRKIRVTGLTTGNGFDLLTTAMNIVLGEESGYDAIVEFGEDGRFHGLLLSTIGAEASEKDGGSVDITCIYERGSNQDPTFTEGSVSFSSSLTSQEVSKDNTGTDVVLGYVYATDDVDSPYDSTATSVAARTHKYSALRQIQVPVFSWTVKKRMKKTRTEMRDFIMTYQGCVNSDTWDEFSARTILAGPIQAESGDAEDGSSYKYWDVTITYTYKENKWDNITRYVKAKSGKAVTDAEITISDAAIDSGFTAEVTSRDYPEVSFSALPYE